MSGITLSNSSLYALALASPVLDVPLSLVSFLAQVSLGGFFLFFPNGKLVPRWIRLILLLDIILAFFNNFPSPTSLFDANWPGWLYLLVTGTVYVALLLSQIYRYRRVSTAVQRQQTKWIVLGVTVVVAFYIGLFVIYLLFPSTITNQNALGGVIVGNIIYPIVLLQIPLSIGFSILRYRLYDIDVLINRTLVYGTLTVLLALLYVGLVIGLGSLVRLFTGQLAQSPRVSPKTLHFPSLVSIPSEENLSGHLP
jgi:hypothetical protein